MKTYASSRRQLTEDQAMAAWARLFRYVLTLPVTRVGSEQITPLTDELDGTAVSEVGECQPSQADDSAPLSPQTTEGQ